MTDDDRNGPPNRVNDWSFVFLIALFVVAASMEHGCDATCDGHRFHLDATGDSSGCNAGCSP